VRTQVKNRPSVRGSRYIAYIPLFALAGLGTLNRAPLGDVILQAVVQGVLTAVVSLILYGRAVSLLGAAGGAAFGALAPVLTALLAIPVLGEWPAPRDWIAIVVISLGVYLLSAGPTLGRRAPAEPGGAA